jgi:tRNA G10  N-methylase Trm11
MEKDIWLVVCNRDSNNELIAGECEALTGEKPVNGIAEGGKIRFVPHAAYLRAGMRVVARGKTIDEFVGKIESLPLDIEGFRIELLNISARIKIKNYETIVALADAIKVCRPNLDEPRHRLLLVVQDTGFTFGEILAEPDRSYRRHDSKPFRTSSSLPTRLARALVNLVMPYAETILDPCCGTGSILLEAQAMGLKAHGGDWNPKMVGMSRKNIAHFGYDASVELTDAREWPELSDAIVTDFPYGKGLEVSEEVIFGILEHAWKLAPVAVFVAGSDLTGWLQEVGYERVEVFRVPKYTGFARYVHRAWQSSLPTGNRHS